MKIIIVGGGKVGYFTAKTLRERHAVQVIERRPDVCARLADSLDLPVLCADGTTVEALAQAGAGKADALVAVTGKDEDNIVACEIAKRRFNVKKTVARSNNPGNVETMRLLGVDLAVNTTTMIAGLIESEVDPAGLKLLATLNRGQAQIVDLEIAAGWERQGARVMELGLPAGCILVAVTRGETLEIPRGGTTLFAGDHVVAVVDEKSRRAFERVFQ